MSPYEPLRRALRRLVVGLQEPGELPQVAADALARGFDSPSLRELAASGSGDTQENRTLFLKAMKEVGLEVPSPDAARRDVVRSWAGQIVAGELDPYEGARRIWWQGWEPLGRPPDLTVFVGLASEWEDDPENREAYERNQRNCQDLWIGVLCDHLLIRRLVRRFARRVCPS